MNCFFFLLLGCCIYFVCVGGGRGGVGAKKASKSFAGSKVRFGLLVGLETPEFLCLRKKKKKTTLCMWCHCVCVCVCVPRVDVCVVDLDAVSYDNIREQIDEVYYLLIRTKNNNEL